MYKVDHPIKAVFIVTLRKKCPYLFSPNAGKYGPGKTPYLDTFHAVSSIAALPSFDHIMCLACSPDTIRDLYKVALQ